MNESIRTVLSFMPWPPSPLPLPADQHARPYTTTLNLETGKATRACIVPQSEPLTEGLDFPQVRKSLVGRKNR